MILHPKSKVKRNAKHAPTKGKCQVLRGLLIVSQFDKTVRLSGNWQLRIDF